MEQYEFVLMLYVQQNNAQLRKGHFSNSSQFQVKMRIFFSISFFLFFFLLSYLKSLRVIKVGSIQLMIIIKWFLLSVLVLEFCDLGLKVGCM